MNHNLTEGVDYYFNSDGYMVLTKKYHIGKGYCCGLGCLHCPYLYEAVPEPRQSELLKIKANEAGQQ